LAESSPLETSSVASHAEPLLTFSGVTKRFPDGTTALAGVELQVPPGEFVSVIGPSGCGKSTLLRIASNLTQATDGAVQVQTRKIGYVFQDPTLLPWRTVQATSSCSPSCAACPRGSAAAGPTPPSPWSA
jgi:NitT/TauT family transport system ATP-binding protein